MQIIPSIGSVVGVTSNVHWAQIIKTPSLYGVVEVEDADGRAQEKGMMLVDRLINAGMTNRIDIRDAERIVTQIGSIVTSCILMFPHEDQVTILIHGQGTAYLKRGATYALLLEQDGTVSGSVKKGDTILILSKTCGSTMSQDAFFGSLDHFSSQEIAEQMTLLLHESAPSDAYAALIFGVIDTSQQPATIDVQPSVQASTADTSTPVGSRFSIHSMFHRIYERVRSWKRHMRMTLHQGISPGFWIMAVCGIILLVSVAIGIKNELFAQRDSTVAKTLTEATQLYAEGMALMELNPIKGRARLLTAKTTLDPVESGISKRTKMGMKVDELYKQIDAALVQAKHIYSQEPTLFYDVGLLKTGSTATYMGLYENTIVLMDGMNKTIYTVDTSTKSGKIVAGGTGFTQVSTLAMFGTSIYALTPDGIQIVPLTASSAKRQVVTKSDQWGTITAMTVFGGNIYLLDTGKSRIWKYIAVDTPDASGFSDIREYLNPDTLPDLSAATGIAIDGSVWIGTKDGKIIRFTQGKENTYSINGVEPSFGMGLVVYTDDVSKNVYVLDGDNKRVVALDKDGMYVAQYQWSGLAAPTNLVVSEKQGKIFLLAKGQIYSIDLTQ